MQIKKKPVISQSFPITHLQTPPRPRTLAPVHQEGNVKNWPPGV